MNNKNNKDKNKKSIEESISIIGAGSWGTTLAVCLSNAGRNIELCSIFPEHNTQMAKARQNKAFLKGISFPRSLNISASLEKALNSQVIVIAIPVKFLNSALKIVKKQNILLSDKVIVSVSKGIEPKSLKRASEIVQEELGISKIAVLSGPNIAKEVASGIPSTSILACKYRKIGGQLQVLFNTSNFRVYLHNDLTGVELGGALKNIIALSCGISDGLGFGTNTKASLVTRGLAEITRLGQKLGANPSTFWGISGLGDLVTTCFSDYSRNRIVGEQIGQGIPISEIIKKMRMVAEGVETAKSAYYLSKRFNIEMPITQEVYSVIYRKKSPHKAVADLMSRSLKAERIK